LKRLLGREVRIPVAREPDPAALITFADDADFPPDLQDGAVFEAALAERQRAGTQPPAQRRVIPLPPPSQDSRPIVNVVLVSHCNFKGNSAYHVLAIAKELHGRGLAPIIAIPDEPESVDDVGRPAFPVLTYEDARASLRFPDGRGPDLIHAWTPRELVRKLTVDLVRSHGCPYVVHLEDNEETVLSFEHGGVDVEALKDLPPPLLDRIVRPRQAHPLRMKRFLEHSAGMTVLVERLLEFVPEGGPAAVIPAGFDETVLSPKAPRENVRAQLGVAATDLVITYPGNIHLVNMEEMRSLWQAVAQVRNAGRAVVLVKTGWGSTQIVDFPALGAGLRDLGWVPRDTVPELLAAADVLVQPGRAGPFNDYRFPSKLPEFLASGRAVVLPRTNIGLELRDGEDALLLERGDADEIAAAIARLADNPALRERLGKAGRAFALRELRWSASADKVIALYDVIASSKRPAPPAWALDGSDAPVKVLALVDALPSPQEATDARSLGVYGFALECSVAAPGGAAANAPCFAICDMPALSATDDHYGALLRKRVLRALLLNGIEEPVVVVDARRVWGDAGRRSGWLDETRLGLRNGLLQYYASRGLSLSRDEVEQMVRAA
jgi:glycosyltransferase involved in cell wall biosynthesis